MQIPRVFYGRYRDVRRLCRKAITRFRRGSSWLEAVEAEGLMETTDDPGLLILDGPDPSVGGEIHYHLYVPMHLFSTDRTLPPLSPAQEEEVFATSLERPWGLLTLCDRQLMYWWFRHADPERRGREGNVDRYRRYLRAVFAAWGLLADEGRRYHGLGSPVEGEDLWQAVSALPHVLARLGVPTGQLSCRGVPVALPSVGPSGLLPMADRSLAGDLLRDVCPRVAVVDVDRRKADAAPEPFRMMVAMLAHDDGAVRRLAEERDPINAPDSATGTAPLGWAARHGYTRVVSDLLDRGVHPDDRCRQDTPLMLAAWGGHRETVRLLLDQGADPTHPEPFWWDAIGYAENRGHDEIAALLRAARGPDVAE